MCDVCSDVGARESLTADEDEDDNDADVDDTDGDVETEDQSSEDEDGGDIDELLDEALDKDTEESKVSANDKSSMTKDATAAAAAPAQPVS